MRYAVVKRGVGNEGVCGRSLVIVDLYKKIDGTEKEGHVPSFPPTSHSYLLLTPR